MEMMINSQSLDQYLWSVTKWWPRVKAILSIMKRELDKQISVPEKVTLKKELFPKLCAHYEDLNEKEAKNCVFSEEVDTITKKKKKVINWTERTPKDCLNDLAAFCDAITDEMDSRYASSVSFAAHKLGSCLDLPDILSLIQGLMGKLTARHQAALDAYGNAEFRSFCRYVCSLVHIKALAKEEPEMKVLPSLSPNVHNRLKDVIFQVVWTNLGD